MKRQDRGPISFGILRTTLLGLLGAIFVAGAFPSPARAACSTSSPTSGSTVTCPDADTTGISGGAGVNNVTVQVTTSGSIITTAGTGAINAAGSGWTVNNAGSLSSTGAATATINLNGGGTLTNSSTGQIQGTHRGYQTAGAASTLDNFGTISTTDYAVLMQSGGTVANETGGTITATTFGVRIQAGSAATNSVTNFGAIAGSGNDGILIDAGGTITNNSGATITGRNNGIRFLTGFGTVTNTGQITATTGTGILFTVGGSLTNQQGGTISGANGTGVQFSGAAASTFTNYGSVTGAVTMGGGDDTITLGTGSSISGNIDGGTGTNNLQLVAGSGTTGTLASSLSNIQSLAVNASGATWTVTGGGTVSAVTIASGSTLQLGNGGTSGSLSGAITDNGTFSVNRSDSYTVSSGISGSGSVVQKGAGTLVLTGTNTYSGGTTVSSGTLSIASDASLGTGGTVILAAGTTLAFTAGGTYAHAITVAGDPFFNVAAGQTVIQSGQISDGASAGTVEVTGGGTLVLSNTANSYSGGTAVTGGSTLSIAADSVLGTGAVTLGDTTTTGTLALTSSLSAARAFTLAAGGGTIDTATGTTATFSGIVSGNGGLAKTGAGTLILSGVNTYSGGTTVAAGILQGTTASLQGNILDNGGVIFAQAGNGTYAGALSGSGSLTKTGAGILELTGTSSLAGPTHISAGAVAINGSLANSNVSADSGTTLSGSGTIGALTASAGAIVSPGNGGAGTLHIRNSLAQAAGSIYRADLSPQDGTSDLILVDGSASIATGAILDVAKSAPGVYALNSRYTLLRAANGLTGTYTLTGDTAISAFYSLIDSYDANHAYLTVIQTKTFASAAQTPNQTSTANALQGLSIGNGLHDAVGSLASEAAAQAAFDQLSGEMTASAKTAMIEHGHLARDAAMRRTRQGLCVLDTPSGSTAGPDLPAGASCDTGQAAVWGEGYGSWASSSSDGNASELHQSANGFFVGADMPVFDQWRAGIFGGYGQQRFAAGGVNAVSTGDNYLLGGYGGRNWGALNLSLGGSHTWLNINSSRLIGLPGYADSLTGSYDAATTQLFGDLGYQLQSDIAKFEPFADFAYVNLDTDGFAEHGGAAALTAQGGNMNTAFSTFGLRAASVFVWDDTRFSVTGSAGWRHAYGDVAPGTTLAFNGGSSFRIGGVPIARDVAVFSAGVNAAVCKDISLGLSYSNQTGSGYLEHAVMGNLSWSL